MKTFVLRVRATAPTIPSALQVGLAAGIAWWLALLILESEQPLYVPIGAVGVAIGAGDNRMLNRPIRLLAGMAVAVVVAGNWCAQWSALISQDDLKRPELAAAIQQLDLAVAVAMDGEGLEYRHPDLWPIEPRVDEADKQSTTAAAVVDQIRRVSEGLGRVSELDRPGI